MGVEEEEGSMSRRSSLSSFLKVLSSYNSNVLLAALVFLLLVVLFVLLLHFYARFFWSHSDQEFSSARRRRRRRRRTVTTTRIIPPAPLGDMWLSSHSTCPLCRSPVLAVSDQENLKPVINDDVDVLEEEEEEEEEEFRLHLFPDGEDENVASLALMEDDLKTGVDDCNGVGEGEVRIEVLDVEISGGGSRGHRRSTSSMASSSLKRMLSSRSRPECSKVFPSATQDSSP
ncbi:hypothetical protein F2Q69_00001012 [Brassica cretica]|uniref:RING-type domain-containing protein n=1 Tax=Brassica cretica TaxID=69181 RepID=A0A8S9PDH4_BRACR|nr:hypothetical protein F2Q69_00001012 [Brassica cretica]